MATSPVQIDPQTGERVQQQDAGVQIDTSTGERVQSQPDPVSPTQLPPEAADDVWKSGIHSKMLDVTPGYAYQNREEIEGQLRDRGGDYDSPGLDPTISNDIKVGLQSSIFGLAERNKLPDEIKDGGMVDKFVQGVAEMLPDIPVYLAGGAVGGVAGSEVPVVGNVVGAAAGGFALPAAMREALTVGIKQGKVQSFGDLMKRAGDVTLAAAKGGATGVVTELAGGLPVGPLAKVPLAATAMKGIYQAAALTTAGDLLDGHVPNAKDFASNAALIIPLNLILHGTPMKSEQSNDAVMDVYTKDGTTPAETQRKLAAQPPVKPDLPAGLKTAINFGENHVEANEGEDHDELASRLLDKKPVTMEALEADPAKADDVLQNPKVHDQGVIDKAWQLKKEAIEAGEVETPTGSDGTPPEPSGERGEASTKVTDISELYNRSDMKSGRGFSTPDGKFLDRGQARRWMKNNEPDVHDMWTKISGGDQEEFHSQDYDFARERVQARNLAEGEPEIGAMAQQNLERLGAARSDLNRIKGGETSDGYGKEVLRTLFSGQRDMRIAKTTQLRDALGKIIPDSIDQEALTYLRDYKGNPEKLQAAIEKYEAGDNEKQKALNDARRRALDPSPNLLNADAKMTEYYTGTRDEASGLGIFESDIDPSSYVPHDLARTDEEGGGGHKPLSKNTRFGRARKYLTLDEAVDSGNENIEARTVNALDTLSIYGDHHATVVATKLLSTELKNTELGKYGTQDSHPEGWVVIAPEQSAFKNARAITDADTGKSHVITESMYGPKKVADALRPLFESGLSETKLSPLLKVQGYVKSLELGLSLFHVKALNITAFNNMGLANFTRSIVADTKSSDFLNEEKGWAADGLTTSKTSTPYEAYEGIKKSSIPTGFDRLSNIPLVKQVDAAFKAVTEYTFDVVQRKWKVQDASLRGASWLANHPDATSDEYFAARRGIAKEVNSVYGGLNWDVLGTGKTMRDVSRLFLLAPDWTFSNVLSAKYAFEGGPAGSSARMFWAKSFATGFALTAAASIAIGGKYDPTDIKHIDQVYLGTDKNGKEMYSDWFFVGAPRDALSLVKKSASDSPIAGTAQYIVGKASPAVSVIKDLAANKGSSGRPIYKEGDETINQAKDQIGYVAGRIVPITGESAVDTVERALKDPSQGYTYSDLLELAADAIGSPTIHQGSSGSSSRKKTSIGSGSRNNGRKKISIRK